MSGDPEALYERVSRALADGETIDWDGLGVDPETRAILEQLKVLAEVARLHRDTLPDPDGTVDLPTPTLHPGETWGHLTLRGELGRGARGFVYRAWDPQLDREVALKLTVDRESERGATDIIGEARLLARVKHPHVATVFGAERRSGLVGLWMELVEGETLEAMLLRVGRFNAREAALIGIDVCSALSAVHAAGLLHRDVKAQNVMRDRNGRLVLMDFGTGRAAAAEGAFVHDEVGTPLYMAPELFAGGKASVQSDIYSVGVLLYRLVTGSVPVEAHSPASLLAAHRAGQRVPLADVRSDLPLAFIHVVERALAPDPAQRHASTGALEMALSSLLVPPEPTPSTRASGARLVAATAAAGALVAGLALGTWWWTSRPMPIPEVRFAVPPAGPREAIQSLALSPDGSAIAYVSAGRLQVRRLNDVTAVELEGTQGARDPFWSPDGQSIGFFKGVSVWKVRASGGDPQMIAPARRPSSGSWNADGTLLYSIDHGSSIVAVSAAGGKTRDVRRQQPGTRTHLAWPAWTGDGEHFVYSAVTTRTGRRTLYLARASDGPDAPDRELAEIASNVALVGDRIVYVSAGQLQARRLDVAAGTLSGDAVTIHDGVATDPYGAGNARISAAAGGPVAGLGRRRARLATVAFVGAIQSPRQLRIVDARGMPIETLASGHMRDMRLSPDGRLVAFEDVDRETGTREIWVHDLSRRSRIRLTQHAAEDIAPVWSRDSASVYFASSRTGRWALFGTSVHGGSREQFLFDLGGRVVPYEVTPDGRSLIVQRLDQEGGWDIWIRSLTGGDARPLVQSPHNDHEPALSPDGRYLAYSSPESGGQQVWIVPVPADGRRWQVSTDYGRAPEWSADGRALFFHGLNRTLMRASADLRGPTPRIGVPRSLFEIPFLGFDMRFHFGVLPGAARFLVNVPADAVAAASATVVLNVPLP